MVMNGIMDSGGMMWGVGSGWVLTCALVVLGVAILVASLWFSKRR
jgi:hypothetical protein